MVVIGTFISMVLRAVPPSVPALKEQRATLSLIRGNSSSNSINSVIAQVRPGAVYKATHANLLYFLQKSQHWNTQANISLDNGKTWKSGTLATNGDKVSEAYPVSLTPGNLSIYTFYPNGSVFEVRDKQDNVPCPEGFLHYTQFDLSICQKRYFETIYVSF